jgi:glutathione synthase
MDILFIIDPPERLAAYKDSSIAMMRAAQARGHAVWIAGREYLRWESDQGSGVTSAQAQRIEVSDDNARWFSVAEEAMRPLRDFTAVLMRQDPPFDMEYVAATWLLQRAEAEGARVFNRPAAIRDHSEKVAITEFAQFAPTTLVARDSRQVQDFINVHGDIVLKPLDGMGGAGVFRVRADEPNRNVIVETVTALGTRTVMAQRYVPAISEGDKRVLLIGGEVVPYALARIPQGGDLRGNLAAGGKGVAMELTPREREIAVSLAPTLWARGLFIVGLDMIGGHLTEINVTSPTCFVEIGTQSGFDVAAFAIGALERACG